MKLSPAQRSRTFGFRRFAPGALAMLVWLAAAPTGPPPAHAQAGAIGRWNFDSGTGADSSGNHFDMTPGGGVNFVNGRGGKTASLNGTDAFLQTPYHPAFTAGAHSWSMTAWIAPATPGTGVTQYILQWYRCGANASCGGADAAIYTLFLDTTGKPGCIFRDDLSNTILLKGTASIVDDSFHFIAATLDSATKRAVLYLDGQKIASDSLPGFTILSDAGLPIPLSIGREFITGWGSPDRYFRGSIDDVRVFARKLSPTEITALFNGVTLDVGGPPATGVALAPVHPNPSRGPARIVFTLSRPGLVHLRVLDVLGREVRVLIDGGQPSGGHQVVWDGNDASGRPVGGGVYFFRLDSRPLSGGGIEVHSVRGTLLR